MRILVVSITCVAATALVACGGATNQPTEVPASTATQAPATPTQEAATTPQPTAGQAATGQAPSQPQASRPRPTAPPAASAPASGTQNPAPTATAYRPPPPKAEMIEVPAGTVLEMELVDPLSSKTNVVGDTFHAKLTDAVTIGGQDVIPAGSVVEGTVTEAISAKKMTGQASLSLEFSKLTLPDGKSVAISGMLTEKGKKIGKRTGAVVGGSAAGGALLGRIIGKNTKGALIGGLLGAAAGTGVAATQKGQELKLPEGTAFSVETSGPVQVPVPARRS